MSLLDTGIPYGLVKVKCAVCGKEFYIDIDVVGEVPKNPICENCLKGWKIEEILKFFEKKWNGGIKVMLETKTDKSYFNYYNGKVHDQENPNTYIFAKNYKWAVERAEAEVDHLTGNCKLVLYLTTVKNAEQNGKEVVWLEKTLPPIAK